MPHSLGFQFYWMYYVNSTQFLKILHKSTLFHYWFVPQLLHYTGKQPQRFTIVNKTHTKFFQIYAFTIDLRPDPVTGKRRKKQKSGFKTLKEAEETVTTFLYEVNNETYINESKMFFRSFAPQWLSIYSKEREVKPGTLLVRQHEIDKLMPYLANVKLKDITSDRYKQTIYNLKKSYADNTVDGIHRTGRMIFKKAIELELIKKDPTAFVILKKEKKTLEELKEPEIPKYLEKEELTLFLDTAAKKGLEKDFLIFLVLSYTGIRVGELVSLQWSDIDFIKNSIRIIKTYYNPSNNTVQYELGTPNVSRK